MFWFYVSGSALAVSLAFLEFANAVRRHHAKVKDHSADRHTVPV